MGDDKWNEQCVKTAMEWGKTALVHKWLHYEAAMYHQKLDKWLGAPGAILSSAMGVSLIGAVNTDNDTAMEVVMWISAVLAFVTAAIVGLYQFMEPGAVAQRHLDKSNFFDDVFMDISTELSLPRRHSPDFFFHVVQGKFALAQKQPPIIPRAFWEKPTQEIVSGQLVNELRGLHLLLLDDQDDTQLPSPPPPPGSSPNCGNVSELDDVNQPVRRFAKRETIGPVMPPSFPQTSLPTRIPKTDNLVLEDAPPSSSSSSSSSNVHQNEGGLEMEDHNPVVEEAIVHMGTPARNIQDDINQEMRRIRAEARKVRQDYQMARLFGKT